MPGAGVEARQNEPGDVALDEQRAAPLLARPSLLARPPPDLLPLRIVSPGRPEAKRSEEQRCRLRAAEPPIARRRPVRHRHRDRVQQLVLAVRVAEGGREHPQLAARGLIADTGHLGLGRVPIARPELEPRLRLRGTPFGVGPAQVRRGVRDLLPVKEGDQVRQRRPSDVGPLRAGGVLVGVELQDVRDLDGSGITAAEIGGVLLGEVGLQRSFSRLTLSIAAARAAFDATGVSDDPAVVGGFVVEAGTLGWTRHRFTIFLMSPRVVCRRPNTS